MNLILTPVYQNFEVTMKMVEAIDKHTRLPYLHILIVDNSRYHQELQASKNRRIIYLYTDIPGVSHKNQLGQCLQLGMDYAKQTCFNGDTDNFRHSRTFIIESDVYVNADWDVKMISRINSLPSDWATLDCMSVDESGEETYPDRLFYSPKTKLKDDKFLDVFDYAMFQCTLINPEIEDLVRVGDIPSHFDILWSRKVEELTKRKFYRDSSIKVIHADGGGSSRKFLQ